MLEDHPDISPERINVDLLRLDAIHDKLAIRNAFEPIDAPRVLLPEPEGPTMTTTSPGKWSGRFLSEHGRFRKFVDAAKFNQ